VLITADWLIESLQFAPELATLVHDFLVPGPFVCATCNEATLEISARQRDKGSGKGRCNACVERDGEVGQSNSTVVEHKTRKKRRKKQASDA
jgi:hypothetical protein